jgi:hypothetical protein
MTRPTGSHPVIQQRRSTPLGGRGRVNGRGRLPVAAVVCVALLAAGCGGGGTQGGVSSSAYTDAVAYAHCMRAQGVGNWPDPTSSGDFLLTGNSPTNPADSPNYTSANKACAHLLPNNGRPTAAQTQKVEAEALKYARCMRAHGVLNFPDPDPNPNHAGINLGGNESIDHNTPQFQSAMQTCRSALPNQLADAKAGGGN